jgi:formamidopyrimidine-DNA glycosylase
VPELPEVETIVRGLSPGLTGTRIGSVAVIRPDLVAGDAVAFTDALSGRPVGAVTRRAKNIVIAVDGDVLVVNLGMTGRLMLSDADAPLPSHLGVRFDLEDGRRLLYQDVRRFGRLEVMDRVAWQVRADAMGVEPLSDAFDGSLLHRLTRGSRSPIKPWLMDQRRVVGVGNIYASEALHRAGINPRRAAGSLSRQRADRLVRAVREVLSEAIEFRGTTLLDYRDASGGRGGFAERLRVYDREGEPCRRCTHPLRRIVQGGRSTFYCTRCQR